ncbi:MAG: hypothetical protein HYW37_00670 [Candidatus Colwellbacteria bacterium]|nr:hypothetical protein [Candidatus Colwellbacteria bacterium]
MARIKEAVASSDVAEDQVYLTFREAFLVAITGIVPALKLVDKPLESWLMRDRRGIHLATDNYIVVVSRQGEFCFCRRTTKRGELSGGVSDVIRDPGFLFHALELNVVSIVGRDHGKLAVAAEILQLLQELQKIIASAMVKNEERHVEMANLLKELGQLGSQSTA